MQKMELLRRLDQEQYILNSIRPSSKKYQPQYQKVKDIKTEIEFFEIQEENLRIKNANSKGD
jgi:hypothetical protein